MKLGAFFVLFTVSIHLFVLEFDEAWYVFYGSLYVL